jgi:hypothetical protein
MYCVMLVIQTNRTRDDITGSVWHSCSGRAVSAISVKEQQTAINNLFTRRQAHLPVEGGNFQRLL